MDQGFVKRLKEFGQVKLNASLAKFTTFKIGGTANIMIEVVETENLVKLLNFLSAEGVEYILLGGGSNLLFPDNELSKVVVKVKTSALKIEGNTIIADAGVSFGVLTNLALKNKLSGLEWSAGLPGTVGGAIRGNAGAVGGETGTVLKKVEAWADGEVVTLTPEECGFTYRDSIFKKNGWVILKAWFGLKPGDSKESLLKMQEILKKRNGYYPTFPSAGSFFKNTPVSSWKNAEELPEEFRKNGFIPTGWLNEKAGLKGLQIGGAMVSKEHGNFLINYQDATQKDVLALVEEVKNRVYNKFKVELEEEVQIVFS